MAATVGSRHPLHHVLSQQHTVGPGDVCMLASSTTAGCECHWYPPLIKGLLKGRPTQTSRQPCRAQLLLQVRLPSSQNAMLASFVGRLLLGSIRRLTCEKLVVYQPQNGLSSGPLLWLRSRLRPGMDTQINNWGQTDGLSN